MTTPAAGREAFTAPWSTAATDLLHAWKGGDTARLDAELDRTADICRIFRGGALPEAERGELLECIVEEMRRSRARARRMSGAEPEDTAVFGRLLAHLAAAPGPRPSPKSLC